MKGLLCTNGGVESKELGLALSFLNLLVVSYSFHVCHQWLLGFPSEPWLLAFVMFFSTLLA